MRHDRRWIGRRAKVSDGLVALEAAQNMRRAAREYQKADESLRNFND